MTSGDACTHPSRARWPHRWHTLVLAGWRAVAVAALTVAPFFESKRTPDMILHLSLWCSSGVSRKTSPLQMLSEDAAVTRRGALMTAAGIALSLRNPSAASAANTVTATMSLNTFEGKLFA